jgi:hypothetical protein
MSRSPISGSSSPVSGQSFRATPLAAYLSQQYGAIGSLGLPPSALEVLLGIAFKQPISQAEIDRLFDVDKRGLVVKLRDLKLLEEFAGADGIFNSSLNLRPEILATKMYLFVIEAQYYRRLSNV